MSGGLTIVAMLFWAAGLARAPWAARNTERRPLCAALLAFAVALTADIPAVYLRVDGWVGVPNVADLVEHVFGMVGVYALLLTLSGLVDRADGPRWAGARLPMLAVAVGASVGLFFAARLPVEATHFTDRYGHLPVIAAYWSITLAYFGVALIELAQVAVRRSGQAQRATLRVGLRVVGVGVILGVVYSMIKIVELVVDEDSAAGAVRRVVDRLDPIVLVTGAIVIGVGLLLPAADTTWHHGRAGVRDRIALLRLRRLWLDLTEATPEVVLGERPSLWTDLCGRNVSFRLYRRVIEINDVILAVRAGETVPALRSGGLEALLADLAPSDTPGDDRASGERDAGSEAEEDLRPLLILAREWEPRRRHRSGVTA